MKASYEYRPVLFFFTAYVVTWIPWCLGVYVGSQEGLEAYAALVNLLGLLGPAAVALCLILMSGNEALKKDFKNRLISLRGIRPTYLIFAVVLPPTMMCTSIWLSLLIGEPTDQFQLAGTSNLLAVIIIALVLAPMIEELGWRGYGVDSLRAKTGMMHTTLLFSVLWSAWHAPLFLISGTYQNELTKMDNPLFVVNFFVSVIPAAFIANWLYYKNNRSIAAAVLVHSTLNAAAVLLNSGQVAKCIATLLYAAVAATIVAIDRSAFAEGPRNFIRSDDRRRERAQSHRSER